MFCLCKNITENTQEMPESRNTAIPRDQTKERSGTNNDKKKNKRQLWNLQTIKQNVRACIYVLGRDVFFYMFFKEKT